MANSNKKQAEINVFIGGTEQANNRLEEMKSNAEKLRKSIEEMTYVQATFAGTNNSMHDKWGIQIEKKKKELKSLSKAIRDTEREVYAVEKKLGDVSGYTEQTLRTEQKTAKQRVARTDPKDIEKMEYEAGMLNQIMEELDRRKNSVSGYTSVLSDIGNAADKTLSAIRMRLQELISSTKENAEEMQKYRAQLAQVEAEEQRRVSERAKDTVKGVQSGTFDGTIGETREALKLLEQYKQQLKITDTKGIKEVEAAMQSLNEKIKQASASTLSLEDALAKAKKINTITSAKTIEELEKATKEAGSDVLNATNEDLQRLKKTLEDYKKSLKVSDTEGFKKINKALSDVEIFENKAAEGAIELKRILGDVKSASLEDLQKAAALLQKELSTATNRTGDYIKQSAKLREVNKEIDKIKKGWEQHDNQIVATMKRLTSYVLVYAGFNEVWGRMKQLFSDNLGLSDSLADIQKTTGLSAESVAELSREIDSIDTRTAQLQLHELAASAGQAGLKTKEDVLGFVRAADQLTIALNELGEDGVNTLLKISNLTGEGKLLGTEKALLAIGSSINELSAASAATAGPIVDIISRIGSVGSISKLSMADMAALGATLDELGQEAEVSGTALTTFITSLQTNTRGIAMALGLDDKELGTMMKAGKTMEAIIMVLEKLGRMGGDEGMKALAPVLKEFGSDGERLNRVLATLSKNTDTLRARVDLSREAYAEANSVTEEANIKQESAIGILNRLGNELKETFVNSGAVESIKEMLLSLMEFVKWMGSGASGAEILKTVVKALTVGFLAYKAAVLAVGAAMFSAKTYTDLLTKSWEALNAVQKKNVIGAVLGVVTALGVVVWDLATSVSAVTKATADYNGELEVEQSRVDVLFEMAKKANDNTKEKRDLIKDINSRYGEYIGFLLSDADGNDKLAAAQERVNAKIRQRLALQLREKMEARASEQYGGQMQDALVGIRNEFEQNNGVTDVRAGEATRMVQKIVNDNITEPMETILFLVRKELETEFNTKSAAHGSAAYLDIQGDLKDYIEAQQEYQKALEVTVSEAKQEVVAADEETLVANNKVLNSLTNEWNELNKVKTDTLDEKQLSEHNAKLEKVAKEYVKVANEQLKLVTGEQKVQLEGYVKYFNQAMSQMEKTAEKKEPNIWGNGHSMEEASVDQLVAKYKKLFDERKTMREDADYTTAYAKEFADRNQAMDWYLEKLKEIEKQLNKMGYDTSGNLLKSGTRKEQKEMRDQIDAAMASLEAYFLRRQQLIRQSYLDEQITTEEMNRQIDNMEEEHLLARVELRKKLLGQANSFDAKQYGMEGKDLDGLSGSLLAMGGDEADGMRKNLEKDLLGVQEMAIKYRQSIEQELLKYNPFDSLVNQFEESLDRLGLLSTDGEKSFRKSLGFDENIGQDEINRRVDALAELSEDAYSMDESQLRSYLSNIDAVWAESMSPEQMSLLLKKLRDFYQESKEATEKYAKDIKDMVDVQWNTSGKGKEWSDREDAAETQSDMIKKASDLGLASSRSSFFGTSDVDNAELTALKTKLDAAQEYFEQFYARKKELINQAVAAGATEQQALESYHLAEKEALESLNAAREEYSNKELEITASKLKSMKDYTDAIVDFSGQMGEAAFKEVADRKAAGKQLLQTVTKLTKDLIMQKVQEVIIKKSLKGEEVDNETSGNQSIVQSAGQTIIQGLTASEKGMGGKITAGIAGGSSKIIEELGWWGIPLIAVISAALNGLMNLAMGAFSKSKEEVAAVTGASASADKGRVAAGMLTYAKGDYPVLGNDGKIYNASYQKELKTGVYGGGAHFGIFSEKKPEMIVDGDTTQKIMLNYPHIYDSILTIARHGQIKSAAMPAYATGNYPVPSVSIQGQPQSVAQTNMTDTQMAEMLSGVASALSALTERLKHPISATVNPYGNKGAVNQLNKASKFMEKRGLIK